MKGTHVISFHRWPAFPQPRMDRDVSVVREIQNRFLPGRLPHIPSLDYFGDCHPEGDIGADFLNFRSLRGDELAFSVGDIAAHGVGAAILMSGVQAFLRGLTGSESGEIAAMVGELNRVVCQVIPDSICVTLFYAQVDPQRREIRYVNAGHEPPLLLRKLTGQVRRLESTGTVLGLTSRTVYRQRTVEMLPGDLLVAFTDGVSEAKNAEGRTWTEEGILSVLRRCRNEPAAHLVAEILESAERFADPMAPPDDRTAAAVRFIDAEELKLRDEAIELAFTAA